VLARTPAVLHAMLTGLCDGWITRPYGPDTFSPFDVVGHLIHGEHTDWIPRARIILEHGESRPFEPFDRYAMYEASKGKTINELLNTFDELRLDNVAELRSLRLTADKLTLKGTHPALGTVTLSQLLATWVAHDLNHIHQIAKCMAWQYKEAIGPWRPFVSFVDR